MNVGGERENFLTPLPINDQLFGVNHRETIFLLFATSSGSHNEKRKRRLKNCILMFLFFPAIDRYVETTHQLYKRLFERFFDVVCTEVTKITGGADRKTSTMGHNDSFTQPSPTLSTVCCTYRFLIVQEREMQTYVTSLRNSMDDSLS